MPVLAAVLLLGPSIVGATVLLPTDLLASHLPWSASEPDVAVNNPTLRDQIDTYHPEQTAIWRRLVGPGEAGWLGDAGMGSPGWWFVGTAALSPFTVLMVAVGAAGPGAAAAARIVVAGTGVGMLARSQGRSSAAAAIAAGAFATSGFMVAWLGWPQTHVAAWIGWVWWAAGRAAREDGPWWSVVAVAGTVAAAWLGGFPAVALLLVLVTAAWSAGEAFAVSGGRWRGVVRAWSGIATGTGLAAVQLVPSLRYLGAVDQSARAELWTGSLPSHLLLRWVVPGAFGDGVTTPFWGRINAVETAASIGVPALLLAVAAVLWRGRDGKVLRLLAVAVFAGGLAYGLPGLDQFQRVVPGLSTNPPARSLVVAAAAAAVLAAHGFDALRDRTSRLDRRGALGVAAVALIALAVAAVHRPDREIIELLNGRLSGAAREAAVATFRTQSALAAGLITVTVLVAAVARSGPAALARTAAGGLVALAVAVPLWTGLGFNTQRPPSTVYPADPAVDQLVSVVGGGRVAGPPGVLLPMTNLAYGFDDARGRRFAPAALRALVEAAGGAYASPTRWDLSTDPADWTPALARIGVTHVVVAAGSPLPAGWTVAGAGPLEVATVPDPVGRVSVAGRVVAAEGPDPVAALARGLPPDTVVIGSDEQPAWAGADPAPPVLEEAQRHGRDVVATVSAPSGAILRTLEPELPGWTATIDGQPAPTLTIDTAFVGVAVPPGTHDVELRWAVPGLPAGTALTLLSALGLLIHLTLALRVRVP